MSSLTLQASSILFYPPISQLTNKTSPYTNTHPFHQIPSDGLCPNSFKSPTTSLLCQEVLSIMVDEEAVPATTESIIAALMLQITLLLANTSPPPTPTGARMPSVPPAYSQPPFTYITQSSLLPNHHQPPEPHPPSHHPYPVASASGLL